MAVLLRRGISTQPGRFERAVERICASLDIPVTWYRPEPGGRDQVFHRDVAMVADADVALAFFTEEERWEGGTAHVVEKAQDREVPVYAYYVDTETVQLRRLGEWDPEERWASRVPRG